MEIWPLKFRKIEDQHLLFVDDAGAYFQSTQDFLGRYVRSDLTSKESAFLTKNGHAFESVDDYQFNGFATRAASRINPPRDINYLILVPTLRCNLKCDYCQVSRVSQKAAGFDWNQETIDQAISFIDKLKTADIKIEFQGGEPLLRVDILKKVRAFCRSRFEKAEFVVCTNLQEVSEEAWQFLDAEDTHVSTSLDGSDLHHKKRRTKSDSAQQLFERNFDKALDLLGEERVSALPTIEPSDPPDPRQLIENFTSKGLHSIYLRRINYQGFARKKFDLKRSLEDWTKYYRKFVDELIDYNATAEIAAEEYYLSHILRRIVRSGHNNHVDLRNPNWLGSDYIVIDYDGVLYPTDEARMVSRIGKVDLSIGSLSTGINEMTRRNLNDAASNFDDPECMHCVYQVFCGLDLVDDLSRYGRIDLPRHKTDHCISHLAIFDLAFELLYSTEERVHKSLATWLGVARYNPSLAPKLL